MKSYYVIEKEKLDEIKKNAYAEYRDFSIEEVIEKIIERSKIVTKFEAPKKNN